MAVGAVMTAGTAVAQAAEGDAMPKVYGKLHVSYGAVVSESKPNGGSTNTLVDGMQFREHASRVGIKGAVPISDSLKATYQLEYGAVGIDSSAQLSNRNQYLGLKGGFGEMRFGRHDTPVKMYQGKFDEFNDTDGDFQSSGSTTVAANGTGGYKHGIFLGDQRLTNIIAYVSPNWGGFDFAAAIAPGEGNGCDGTEAGGCDVAGGGNGGNGPADIISLAAKFKMGGLFVSGGYNSYDSKAANGYKDLLRLVATYGNKMFQVGAAYEDAGKNTIGGVDQKNDKTSIGLSGHIAFANVHKIKLQYLQGKEKKTGGDLESAQISFGYDYKMAKATTAYAMYNVYAQKDKSTAGNDDEYASGFIGIGMIQNF